MPVNRAFLHKENFFEQEIAHDLRAQGFVVEMPYTGNMAKRLKKANKMNARAAIIMGSQEEEQGVVILRDLDSGEQKNVALNALTDALKTL